MERRRFVQCRCKQFERIARDGSSEWPVRVGSNTQDRISLPDGFLGPRRQNRIGDESDRVVLRFKVIQRGRRIVFVEAIIARIPRDIGCACDQRAGMRASGPREGFEKRV